MSRRHAEGLLWRDGVGDATRARRGELLADRIDASRRGTSRRDQMGALRGRARLLPLVTAGGD